MSEQFDDDEDLDKLDRGDTFNYDDDEDEDDTTGTSDSDEDSSDSESDRDDDLDEDDEPNEDEEVEDEEVEKPKKIYIPKDRFDEVNKEKHLLQDQLNKVLEALLEKDKSSKKEEEETPTYDFDAAEEEYISLVIEGETKAALAKRKEINAALEAKLQKTTSGKQSEDTDVKKLIQAEIAERDFKTLVSTFESQHSFLNPKNKAYNEEAVDTVNTLMKGYLASGKDKATSLSLAVKKVIPMYVTETKVDKTKPKLGDERKTEAGKKAAQTAKQPAVKSSSKSNIDISKVSVKDIKDKDLFSLSRDEQRRLRGDFL